MICYFLSGKNFYLLMCKSEFTMYLKAKKQMNWPQSLANVAHTNERMQAI